jgi:predicted transcriptional regulator
MNFGDTPQLRVMDFLIDNHFFDFPITEIAKSANVSYNSIKQFFQKFVESGFIIKTRHIGKSDYFQLNVKNEFISELIKLDWMLTKNSVKERKVIA